MAVQEGVPTRARPGNVGCCQKAARDEVSLKFRRVHLVGAPDFVRRGGIHFA